jgi:hypothetical protein
MGSEPLVGVPLEAFAGPCLVRVLVSLGVSPVDGEAVKCFSTRTGWYGVTLLGRFDSHSLPPAPPQVGLGQVECGALNSGRPE